MFKYTYMTIGTSQMSCVPQLYHQMVPTDRNPTTPKP